MSSSANKRFRCRFWSAVLKVWLLQLLLLLAAFVASSQGIAVLRDLAILFYWPGALVLSPLLMVLPKHGNVADVLGQFLFVFCVTALYTAPIAVVIHWYLKNVSPRLSPKDTEHCRHCGYSLHALPLPRCPECGTAFESAIVPSDTADESAVTRAVIDELMRGGEASPPKPNARTD